MQINKTPSDVSSKYSRAIDLVVPVPELESFSGQSAAISLRELESRLSFGRRQRRLSIVYSDTVLMRLSLTNDLRRAEGSRDNARGKHFEVEKRNYFPLFRLQLQCHRVKC